jgi:hypothetical protein
VENIELIEDDKIKVVIFILKYRRLFIMAEIKFEIKETIGVLSNGAKGWTKELNL